MVTWYKNPDVKIEAGATDISSDFHTVTVHRPENGISRAIITVNDFYGKNYEANVDAFTVMKASLKATATDGWTQVFEGKSVRPGPSLAANQTMTTLAYGYGRALRNTHCDKNYGLESDNNSLTTPEGIWDDLIANMINKSFGGAATGYGILDAKIPSLTDPTIFFIEGGYRSNLQMVNDLCTIYQGYRAGSAGVHWYVDPSKNLRIDTIGSHTVDTTNWPTWWRTDQAGSTLVEGTDFTRSDFHKVVWPHFANKVVLYCDLRKPGYDYLTEDSGGQSLFGRHLLTSLTDSNAANKFVVGSHSLLATSNGAVTGYSWYPSSSLSSDAASGQKAVAVTTTTNFKAGDAVRLWDSTPQGEDATIASIAGSTLTMEDNLTNAYTTGNNAHCSKQLGWNLNEFGSVKNPPTLNFYYLPEANTAVASTVVMMKTVSDPTSNDYFYANFATNADLGKWHHCSIPLGDFYKTGDYQRDVDWTTGGSAVWTNINALGFYNTGSGPSSLLYIDDLHITGKIIREAYDQSDIDSKGEEIQKLLRYDVAVDDTMKAADDSGTAGRLAYGELLRRMVTPEVGVFQTPLAVDALPGQLIHVHADAYSGAAWRVDADFRIKEVVHTITKAGGFTTWDVTSDVLNTFVPGFNDALTMYHRAVHTDPEMKNLFSTGLDPYVSRLSKDYQ